MLALNKLLVLGKADLEGMRCQHPDCTEEHGELVLRSRCHPAAGLKAVFEPDRGNVGDDLPGVRGVRREGCSGRPAGWGELMRILFLDDSPARWDAFWRANCDQHECRWAKDAPQAIAGLDAEPRFDLVTLDHDLSEEHYLDQHYEGPGTGQDVARHIATMPPERRPLRVKLHTYNTAGAVAMKAILCDAGIDAPWMPFSGKVEK